MGTSAVPEAVDPNEPVSGFALYLHSSRAPLVVLVFLAPLIVFYEIGAVFVLNEADDGTLLVARSLISTLFGLFGVVGLHLPAALLVAVLLGQHAVGKHAWRVPWRTPLVMAGESLLWSLPILVLGGVLGVITLGAAAATEITMLEGSIIAVGAGLYEELVFRFALIAMIHVLLVEVCGVKPELSDWLAIIGSSVAFAAYHGLGPAGGEGAIAVFYLGAGVLLAWLFLTRGLGIAAGAHAVYDLLVLLVLPTIAGAVPASG